MIRTWPDGTGCHGWGCGVRNSCLAEITTRFAQQPSRRHGQTPSELVPPLTDPRRIRQAPRPAASKVERCKHRWWRRSQPARYERVSLIRRQLSPRPCIRWAHSLFEPAPAGAASNAADKIPVAGVVHIKRETHSGLLFEMLVVGVVPGARSIVCGVAECRVAFASAGASLGSTKGKRCPSSPPPLA